MRRARAYGVFVVLAALGSGLTATHDDVTGAVAAAPATTQARASGNATAATDAAPSGNGGADDTAPPTTAPPSTTATTTPPTTAPATTAATAPPTTAAPATTVGSSAPPAAPTTTVRPPLSADARDVLAKVQAFVPSFTRLLPGSGWILDGDPAIDVPGAADAPDWVRTGGVRCDATWMAWSTGSDYDVDVGLQARTKRGLPLTSPVHGGVYPTSTGDTTAELAVLAVSHPAGAEAAKALVRTMVSDIRSRCALVSVPFDDPDSGRRELSMLTTTVDPVTVDGTDEAFAAVQDGPSTNGADQAANPFRLVIMRRGEFVVALGIARLADDPIDAYVAVGAEVLRALDIPVAIVS